VAGQEQLEQLEADWEASTIQLEDASGEQDIGAQAAEVEV
jgi:hypothetical protein